MAVELQMEEQLVEEYKQVGEVSERGVVCVAGGESDSSGG